LLLIGAFLIFVQDYLKTNDGNQMQEIKIHEVGLRDGLQMESELIPTIHKEQWIVELFESNVDVIQIGSFVHPKYVPQMADTDELFEMFSSDDRKPDNVLLSGLVLNEKGMERGMKCGVEMFCMGVSASETHSMKNTKMSTSEAQERIIAMAKETMSAGKLVQASVQSAFGCGFEGKIDEEKVLSIVKRYLDAGVRNISLADTAGMGNPAQVERLFTAIKEMDQEVTLACHFHNTYGMGLANVITAMRCGVTYIESAFGGLGGCPFTKSPSGNVCTEDLVYMLQEMGMRQDVDINKIIGISNYLAGFLMRDLPGYVYKLKSNK
jgi:hydroxymethylglutaryl-CoA lyase